MIIIRKKPIAYFSYDYSPFEPEFNRVPKKELEEYIKDNPLPFDREHCYPEDDLKDDLLQSTGGLYFPDCISDEMMEYIENLLNYFF